MFTAISYPHPLNCNLGHGSVQLVPLKITSPQFSLTILTTLGSRILVIPKENWQRSSGEDSGLEA